MNRRFQFVAILLIVLASARIISTYTVFSATLDEGMHLTSGLQILDEHAYTIHIVNPPLPRILTALGPSLAGARYDATRLGLDQALVKFHETGHYKTLLVLARVGTLPFFLLAAVATLVWARRELGDLGALIALAFFTMEPSVLAHAGLATQDVAGTAGFAVCMVTFSRWLESPVWRRAAVLGLAYGFAVGCKLLCLVYVPLACAAIYAVRLAIDPDTRARWRSIVTILLVPPISAFVVWAIYGFSIGKEPWLASFPVPAPMFLRALAEIIEGNRQGITGHALGMESPDGWWWYYPLALGLKTTLGALVLVACGWILAWRDRRYLEPLAAPLAILALATTTKVDLGVRYILPIYVPLSVAAAAAAIAVFRHRRRWIRGMAILLISWTSVASCFSHPDYIAYFNAIVRENPSYFLIDSNLDWGQDILRLRNVLREERVSRVGLAVVGVDDFQLLGFPSYYALDAWTPSRGWVAVSEGAYRVLGVRGGWRWLHGHRYRRVGKSIRLYSIP